MYISTKYIKRTEKSDWEVALYIGDQCNSNNSILIDKNFAKIEEVYDVRSKVGLTVDLPISLEDMQIGGKYNMPDDLNAAGFNPKADVKDTAEFSAISDLVLPFAISPHASGDFTAMLLSDCRSIKAEAQPLDIDWFKENVKPIVFDPVYRWVLENSKYAKVISQGKVHRTLRARHVFGFECLDFYITFNSYHRRLELVRGSNSSGNTFGVSAVEFLQKVKDKISAGSCLFVPLDLSAWDEYPVILFGGDDCSSLGYNILASHMLASSVKESVARGRIIKPETFYFIKRHKNKEGYYFVVDRNKRL